MTVAYKNNPELGTHNIHSYESYHVIVSNTNCDALLADDGTPIQHTLIGLRAWISNVNLVATIPSYSTGSPTEAVAAYHKQTNFMLCRE